MTQLLYSYPVLPTATSAQNLLLWIKVSTPLAGGFAACSRAQFSSLNRGMYNLFIFSLSWKGS